MIWLSILAIILIGSLIGFLQSKLDDEFSANIENKQTELFDKLQGNPLVVRELKARAETTIHYDMKQYHDIDYKPKNLREVTTPEERAARHKAEIEGRPYVHQWTEEQIEEVIQEMINFLDVSRDELLIILAYKGEMFAQSYSEECSVSMKDARFVIEQICSVLAGEIDEYEYLNIEDDTAE